MSKNSPRLSVPFYRLTEVELRQHYKDNLINATGYLFYIRHIACPPNKQFIIPNIVKFCEHWGIARPSFYRAVDQLKAKGYMTWEATHGLIFIDTSKVVDFIPSDGKCLDTDTVSHSRTEIIKDGQAISEVDNESHKRDSDIYIDCVRVQSNTEITDNILPLPPQGGKEGERIFGFEIRQEPLLQPIATLLSQSGATQSTSQIVVKAGIAPARVDPFFNRRRDPRDISWDWLPDGPWRSQEGKLEPEFWNAVATRWVKDHGGDIHEKKVNVLKHFRNDPTNLAIEWEWYQSTTIHRAANIQTRKVNGLDTTADEQEIIKHSAALKEIPNEMRVTGSKASDKIVEEVAGYATPYVHQLDKGSPTPQLESVATVTEDAWDAIASNMADMEAQVYQEIAPEGAEDVQMYVRKPNPDARAYFENLDRIKKESAINPVAAPVTSQPIKQQIKSLSDRLSMPKAKHLQQKEVTRLSRWNDLLLSGLPTVIADVEKQALAAGYIILDGQVVEPEF